MRPLIDVWREGFLGIGGLRSPSRLEESSMRGGNATWTCVSEHVGGVGIWTFSLGVSDENHWSMR